MRLLRRSYVSFAIVLGACGGKTEDAPATDAGFDTSVTIDSSPVFDSTPTLDSTPLRDSSIPDGTLPPGATPPPRPTTTSTGGTTRWFAVQRFQLGVSRKGTTTSDPNAWKDFGFDLDGRTTTAEDSKTSNDSCKRKSGSPTSILTDGNAGRDNNFGGHVMQTIKSLKSDTEDAVDARIASGDSTLLIRLDGVGPLDNAHVPGALYIANHLTGTGAPKFTEADVWPVTSDSLVDGATIAKARFDFPNGYIAGGVWVSGDLGVGTNPLPLPLFATLVPFALEAGLVTLDTTTGEGTIAGAARTDALKPAMTGGLIEFGICPGNATYDQVVDTLTQSADLVSGAVQLQNPLVECDSISVGIGLTAKPTGAPTSVAAPLPTPGGC